MMTDQQYNEFFRNRLDDFSSPVPGYIWKNMEPDSRKSAGGWLKSIRYVLLVFSLLVVIRISDKLTMSDVRKNTDPLSKTTAKQDSSMYSSMWKDVIKKQDVVRKSVTVQNSVGYYSGVKIKRTKRLSMQKAVNTKEQMSNQIIYGNRNESSDSAASFFRKMTDSVASHAPEVRKSESLQKQTDSTAGNMVETHTVSDHWSLYLFASPDAVFSHVSADNSDYQQQRNREAKSKLSWSAGVRIRYNINSHWSGNIGAQLSAINEKIRLADRTSYNHYTSLDVPLIAGYRIYIKSFELDANAGVILNISSAYKGYISSVSNEPLDVHNEQIYKSNTSLSYYGGIQFLYRPGSKISLFTEPYFKYQPQNIASSFQPFEERMQKAGLLLGARYRFNE